MDLRVGDESVEDGHTDNDAFVDVSPTPNGRPIAHEMLRGFENLIIRQGSWNDECLWQTGAELVIFVGAADSPSFVAVASLHFALPIVSVSEELHFVNSLSRW
jgi:hypothetical protein